MKNLVNMDNSRGYLTCLRKVNCTLHFLSAIVVFLVCMLVSSTSAVDYGDCWAQRELNTCNTLLKKNVTKEECCKYSGKGISWTERSYNFSDIFKLTNLRNGVPNCQPCRESCHEVDCGNDKKCVMKRGKPRCICSPNCSKKKGEPRGVVCATDGRDYRNKCVMMKKRCRNGKDIEVEYFGTCKDSCYGVVCPDEERCVEDHSGRPYCVPCSSYCPHSVQTPFICGENGVTYESLCQLKRTECMLGKIIDIAHYGKCENLTTCAELSCVEKKKCVMDNDEPRCVVCDFQCYGWRERGPLCASNGITYYNWCRLQEYICNTTVYLDIEGEGICEDGELYEVAEEGSENDISPLLRFLVSGGGGTSQEIDEDIPDIFPEKFILVNNYTNETASVSSTEVTTSPVDTFENDDQLTKLDDILGDNGNQ